MLVQYVTSMMALLESTCAHVVSDILYCQRLVVPLAIAIALNLFARAIASAGVIVCAA